MVAMSSVCGSSCTVKPVQGKLFYKNCAARNAVHMQRHLVSSKSNVRVSTAYHRLPTCGIARRLHNFISSAVAEQSVTTNTADVQDVEFSWDGDAREVLLTGDFLKWDDRLSLTKTGNGIFSLFQKLAPGNYKYKFIVDGEWKHSTKLPTVPDGNGGFNNSISIVKAEATSSSSAPPSPDSSSSPPAKKAMAKAAAKKVAAKPIAASMSEDIIPMLKEALEKETGLTQLNLTFQNNQLRGSFAKGGVPYCIYAFFPDGNLDGSRGFALTSYNAQPSTVEPFLIDERKVSPDLVVFWIRKRLFAQKLLSLN